MDPAHPQRPSVESREITRVQQWVLSALVATTILHLSVGLAVAGVYADGSRAGAGVGLNILAAVQSASAPSSLPASSTGVRRSHGGCFSGLTPGVAGLWFVLH